MINSSSNSSSCSIRGCCVSIIVGSIPHRSVYSYQAKIKKESEEEQENFLQEISRFNSDFSLRGNRETVFESPTHTEILNLEREVDSLYKGHKRLFIVLLSQ